MIRYTFVGLASEAELLAHRENVNLASVPPPPIAGRFNALQRVSLSRNG